MAYQDNIIFRLMGNMNFNVLFVPFKVMKLKKPEGVWIQSDAFPTELEQYFDKNILNQKSRLEQMASIWGYVTPDSETFNFNNISINEGFEVAFAESYGGRLIGKNGGGGRVGIVNGLQLKGIGKTPLVGKNTDIQHSYGALILDQALTETLYSYLMEYILPFGCTKIYGIISTGVKIQFNNENMNRWRGNANTALLLREACLRPAHFLPAEFFEPKQNYTNLIDDKQRVRCLFKEVAAMKRGNVLFEQMIFKFLYRSAAQFASARLNRFTHGTLSPSNISMDGRWLDLMSTSNLPTGRNYKTGPNSPAFLSEHLIPLEITMELVYLYNKYNKKNVSELQFSDYYDQQWENQKIFQLAKFLGINNIVWSKSFSEFNDLKILSNEIYRIISKPSKVIFGWPELQRSVAKSYEFYPPENDFFWKKICELFFHKDSISFSFFDKLMKLEFENDQTYDGHISYSSFRIKKFIEISKKILFSAYFFRSRIDRFAYEISKLCSNKCNEWLVNNMKLIDMIFKNNIGTIVYIFNFMGTSIFFDLTSRLFTFELKSENISISGDSTHIVNQLELMDGNIFVYYNFDFLPGCISIIKNIDL